MGWIFLMFAIFSIIANILEKTAKTQRPPGLPSQDKQGGGSPTPKPVTFPPFLFEEFEEKAEKPVSRGYVEESVVREDYREALSAAKKSGVKTTSRKKTPSFEDEFDQDFSEQFFLSWEQSDDDFTEETKIGEEQWEVESKQFLSALVLAQIVARPDFRTIPWQRRL